MKEETPYSRLAISEETEKIERRNESYGLRTLQIAKANSHSAEDDRTIEQAQASYVGAEGGPGVEPTEDALNGHPSKFTS